MKEKDQNLQRELDDEKSQLALMAISLTQKDAEINALLLIIDDLQTKNNQKEEEIIIEYFPEAKITKLSL
ncbi:hypothetical protein [Algoriphagus aquimarinus]|uniref:hypothetical protein n=1 Tax=Algoriphagus aquimarinus TaxID=237018 RepID=UPI001C3148C3|nr:hypothetical protein [Algoriphagus aquimarinus]